MMGLEGPFLAAVIARLPEPKFNLAAYGVAFAFAILVEAPIIMIMSASTALVEDADSYRKLRNFTYTLNAVITGVMLVVLIPPTFTFIVQDTSDYGIQVVAATGDTIRAATSVTPAAGNIAATDDGCTVQLIAINDTEWIAVYYVGTWTVSS